MLIAKVENGTVLEVAEHQTMFISNAFPDGVTAEWLAEHSCMPVNLFKPHDRLTEVIEPCAPYIEGEWVYTIQVRNMTNEEIEAQKQSAMAQLRTDRNRLLAATDWRYRKDLTTTAEWDAYCQALRDFPTTVEDARLPYTFPVSPTN
jgi:hypothetical protein